MISTTYQKIVFAITILYLFASSNVEAASIKPKYVKFDVEHSHNIYRNNTTLMKRKYDKTAITDQHSYYMVNVQIGSNKQNSKMIIDSGSSDMFVIDSSACSSCSYGTFQKSLSSSFKAITGTFTEYFGSGKASGTWGQDSVTAANINIPNQRFAIATTYPESFGVFGIGFSPDVINQSPSYPTFPKNLKTKGHISKVAYSFYAGDYGNNNGHLMFGGVDTAKFSGSLQKLNMVNVHPTQSSHATTNSLQLTGISLDSTYSSIKGTSLTTTAATYLIDTGTSFTIIPTAAMNTLVTSLKATKSGGSYFVDCNLINKDISVDFNFQGVHIKTPLKNLLYQESSTQCLLGVTGSDSVRIFGANALRSAYVVFDMEDYAIYLAQAKEDATASNIKVITNTVPTS